MYKVYRAQNLGFRVEGLGCAQVLGAIRVHKA